MCKPDPIGFQILGFFEPTPNLQPSSYRSFTCAPRGTPNFLRTRDTGQQSSHSARTTNDNSHLASGRIRPQRVLLPRNLSRPRSHLGDQQHHIHVSPKERQSLLKIHGKVSKRPAPAERVVKVGDACECNLHHHQPHHQPARPYCRMWHVTEILCWTGQLVQATCIITGIPLHRKGFEIFSDLAQPQALTRISNKRVRHIGRYMRLQNVTRKGDKSVGI